MVRSRTLQVLIAIVGGLTAMIGTGEPAQAESLAVGAPPSVKATLDEILPMFEKEYGVSVTVVYSPSKTLSRQIEQGAPIDVFLAAGVEEVEDLHKKGLTLNGDPRIYAQTSLVLVMPADSWASLVSFHEALPNRAIRIAVGDPTTSALGRITARAFATLKLPYQNSAHILHAPHSDDIMKWIHTGKADVGLVYRVDAIQSGHVRITDDTPLGTYVPVQFGQAVVWTCRDTMFPIAEQFSDFLMTPRIQKLLLKHGFDPMPSPNG